MKKPTVEDIIYYLIECSCPVTIKEISRHFMISEKTVWNRLHNEMLNQLLGNRVKLILKNNVGIYLEGETEELGSLKRRILKSLGSKNYQHELRQNHILLDLLLGKEEYTIKGLMDRHLVSRNHIIQDLNDLQKYIEPLDLVIKKTQNSGVSILGDEILIRQLLEKTILQTSFFYKKSLNKDIKFDEGIQMVLDELLLEKELVRAIYVVEKVQQKILKPFTDEGRKELILQIIISQYRSSIDNDIQYVEYDLDKDKIRFREFIKLFLDNKIFLKENDYIYLWKRCVLNRFASNDDYQINNKLLEMSRSLLNSIMDIKYNEENELLIKNLAYHLSQAINRSKEGIKPNNPILPKIKQEYGKFYSMVLTNVQIIEEEFNVSFNEDEIGFITIYISSIYETNLNKEFHKVLLISDSGIGQTQLMAMRLMKKFQNLLIHDMKTTMNIEEFQLQNCDVILTTRPILTKPIYRNKIIRISNFVSEDDIEKIKEHLNKKYILKTNENDFLNNDIDFRFFRSDSDSREDILNRYIQIATNEEYCTNRLLESVFEREKRSSTSIGQGIAIPHGNSAYIKKQAVFIIKNNKKVSWGKEEVDIVLLLLLRFEKLSENRNFFVRLYSCLERTELIRNIDNENQLEELKKYILKGD